MAKEAIFTPVCTLGPFVSLFEMAKPLQEGDTPKYRCNLHFDKETDISELKKAAIAAAKDKFGDKIPKSLALPFLDILEKYDTEKYPQYAKGGVLIRAQSQYKPAIVDRRTEIITDPSAMHPGCKVKAKLVFSAYDMGVKKGVTVYIQALQKVGEGERYDDFVPESGFDKLDEDEDIDF